MDKNIKDTLHADGTNIAIITSIHTKEDYISLTDMAKRKNPIAPKDVVKNWMRLRSTIEFLGLWEQLNNPSFKGVEFDSFKNNAGENSFTLSPQQWIKSTNAIGIISKSGRYDGGTYAHKDIAFEFASWLSPEFKLYIIKDYQRLKEDENHRLSLDWNVKRILAKANYQVHTNAIRDKLIPPELPKNKQGFVYADEADVLNIALFGQTAKQWRNANPDKKGNIRDYATIEQLLILVNLENINAYLIQQGIPQSNRLAQLRDVVIEQAKMFSQNVSSAKLEFTQNKLHE